jgi:hypothetical protein
LLPGALAEVVITQRNRREVVVVLVVCFKVTQVLRPDLLIM